MVILGMALRWIRFEARRSRHHNMYRGFLFCNYGINLRDIVCNRNLFSRHRLILLWRLFCNFSRLRTLRCYIWGLRIPPLVRRISRQSDLKDGCSPAAPGVLSNREFGRCRCCSITVYHISRKGVRYPSTLRYVSNTSKIFWFLTNLQKSEKISILRFRRRKHSMRKIGHRQKFTKIQIKEIKAG